MQSPKLSFRGTPIPFCKLQAVEGPLREQRGGSFLSWRGLVLKCLGLTPFHIL